MTTTHRTLSMSIRNLHRELLGVAQREHAAIHGPTRSPYELLRLVEEDALFAWLKPLTAALAELDDADDPTEPERLWKAIDGVERLLTGGDAAFAGVYSHHLQTAPEVTVAHGQVRTALRALRPQPRLSESARSTAALG